MIRVNNEQYITLQEYAERENVTIQTVYNWIKNKKVETKKIMNTTLIKCWFFCFKLLKNFKNKRYIGEWFNLNDDDIKLLLSDDLENIFTKQSNYNKRRY